jgi:hypothetical protein
MSSTNFAIMPDKTGPKTYEDKLNENKTNFEMLMIRLKKSYPLYKANPNNEEYRSIYENDVANIQKTYNDLLQIENNIAKSSNYLSRKMASNNQEIERNKQIYNENKTNLISLQNENNAGVPREGEYNFLLNIQYANLAFELGLVSIAIYSMYRLMKV